MFAQSVVIQYQHALDQTLSRLSAAASAGQVKSTVGLEINCGIPASCVGNEHRDFGMQYSIEVNGWRLPMRGRVLSRLPIRIRTCMSITRRLPMTDYQPCPRCEQLHATDETYCPDCLIHVMFERIKRQNLNALRRDMRL